MSCLACSVKGAIDSRRWWTLRVAWCVLFRYFFCLYIFSRPAFRDARQHKTPCNPVIILSLCRNNNTTTRAATYFSLIKREAQTKKPKQNKKAARRLFICRSEKFQIAQEFQTLTSTRCSSRALKYGRNERDAERVGERKREKRPDLHETERRLKVSAGTQRPLVVMDEPRLIKTKIQLNDDDSPL